MTDREIIELARRYEPDNERLTNYERACLLRFACLTIAGLRRRRWRRRRRVCGLVGRGRVFAVEVSSDASDDSGACDGVECASSGVGEAFG